METLHWIGELLQDAGIITGFIFTLHTLRKDTAARRLSNLLSFAQQHQAIWKDWPERKELSRIMDKRAVLATKPLSHEERRFVTQLVVHLDGVHRAMKAKLVVNIAGVRKDVRDFFALPVPQAAWQMLKPYQDADFIAFVEDCQRESQAEFLRS
ncbi:MAG: hypothetical protein HY043_23145 [Verrucomicrobia bacterium]|nr:hypothetical protein [Verrucomicrobiota bacterium]